MKKPQIKVLGNNEKLNLTNNGELSLFWLGVGSAFSKKNFQTNMLIIKKDTHILVDCGTRCPAALNQYGLSAIDINSLLITHSHADHIGGLEEIVLMNRYIAKKKLDLIITKEYQDILWHFSLKGGCAYNERHNGKILKFEDFFNAFNPDKILDKPRTTYEINYKEINIKLFRTKHIPDNSKTWSDSFLSYGIIIDDKVLFTSDTKHDPDLIYNFLNKYNTIQTIFHDCQFFDGGVHASYNELLTYPDEIKKMIYLSHYGDNQQDFNPEQDGFGGFTKQGHFYIFN